MNIVRELSLMDNFTVFLVFLVTFLVVYISTRRLTGVPPGPPCWPFIGNLGSLAGTDTLHTLRKLREKYGDVYGLYIGSELTVVLNGYSAIHEALVKKGSLFMFRPDNYFTRNQELKGGILFENGKEFKARRTFVMNSIRELCYSRNGAVLETLIYDELTCLTDHIDSLEEPSCLRKPLSLSLANVIFSILHGRRAGYNNGRFNWYLKTLETGFKDFTANQIKCYCFPFLRYLPGDLLGEKWCAKTSRELHKYFDEMCRTQFETYEEGRQSCIVDFLLQEDSPSTKETLWRTLHELMAAGSETSATTLNWLIQLLVVFPDTQEKLYNEIVKSIRDDAPSVRDKGSIPYVEATILETLRIGSNIPLSMPHFTLDDVFFRGYLIPKGTTILPNLASVHYDPLIFQDPLTFKPERFLDKDELRVIPSSNVIPFSLGQRSCLGESLARIELFMYITVLVKRYKFVKPDKSGMPSLKGVFGITHRPLDYPVNVIRR
ncbi:cytochrome P450 2U1-like [Mya arenaria]|uniref:cytochrome P450 2U1-like n=1 Tax=Mya arenaria TaxID=6604 RepID=UPI0022E046DC|nr:cytochrome P450 2U1-like [Mya arenaria]